MLTRSFTMILALALAVSTFSCESSFTVKVRTQQSSYRGKARIAGFVSDKQTGEMLIGANVSIDSSSLGAATNLEGYFRIDNVPAGTRYVNLSYIGYQPIKHFKLKVEPDKLIQLDVEMVQQPILILE